MAGGLQACTELEHLIPALQELTAGLLVVLLEPSPALGQPLLPGLQLLQQGCPYPHQRPEMGQHGRDILELGGGKGTRGYRSTQPTMVLLTLILGVILCSRSPRCGAQGAGSPRGTQPRGDTGWGRAFCHTHPPRGGHHTPQVLPKDLEALQLPSQPLPVPQQPRQLLLQAVSIGSPPCHPCPLPPGCRNLGAAGTVAAGTRPHRGTALSPVVPTP